MTDITPPPELVVQWMEEDEGGPGIARRIATRSSQWGADQELEACNNWLVLNGYGDAASKLRAARRPKPPNLKEQALRAAHIEVDPQGKNGSLIIRALEALPDD
jgi:hypothetical protein